MQETNFENITNTEDNASVDLTKSNVKRKNVNIVRFTGVIINRNSNISYFLNFRLSLIKFFLIILIFVKI